MSNPLVCPTICQAWGGGIAIDRCITIESIRVMRGANCWTDHKLVWAKLNIEVHHTTKRRDTGRALFAIHDLRMQTKREE